MKRIFPTRSQWSKWTLPSKLTCIGAYVGIVSLIISSLIIIWPSSSKQTVSSNTVTVSSYGDGSPSIYAPSGTGVTVNYGISEKAFTELTDHVKGKDKVIAYLLEDLESKKVEIKKIEALVQDWIQMYNELEKRSAERLSNPDGTAQKTEPLTKFSHQEFIDNFVAFRAYYKYRKTLLLLNPDMLVEVLNIYFRSVILYPSNTIKKYYVNASNGKLLLLQIERHNEKGEKISISLPDISRSLLLDVCTDFMKSAEPKDYEILMNLFNRALATPELDKTIKADVLDAKNMIQKHELFHDAGNGSHGMISQ